MKKRGIITWVFLIIFTIASAILSNIQGKYIVFLIMLLGILKFIGVAFQFMELRKAHIFWKILLLSYLILFGTLVLVL